MTDVDGRALSEYIAGGRQHFDIVIRSWSVFQRNASELHALLLSVEKNPGLAIQLMGPVFSQSDSEFTREFWAGLDQRLHNMLAGAGSLVDHARNLQEFYQDSSPAFFAEFERRNGLVRDEPATGFLRRLRNYLLHYRQAPTGQSLTLRQSGDGDETSMHTIYFEKDGLLQFDGWNGKDRAFIEGFEQGPPIKQLAEEYFERMSAFYQWVHSQYSVLHVPGEIPPHLMPDDFDPRTDVVRH